MEQAVTSTLARMFLSVLIPSLARRADFLARLLSVLQPQVVPGVEILIDIDSGEKSIGEKRNRLIQRATGSHVAFVDDDDMVSPDYVQHLLDGAKRGVDVVSIRGEHTRNGQPWRKFIDEVGKPFSMTERDGMRTIFYGLQHLDAIRRSIAEQFEFPPIRFGEDRHFALKIEQSGLVRTSWQVPTDVYVYQFRTHKEA